MAVTLEGGCRVSNMREGDPVLNGTVCIWNQIGKATGAQAISLRVMEFGPGLSPGIRNGDGDEILYVASSGLSDGDQNEVSTTRVSRWVNFLIDGCTYQIDSDTGIYIGPHQTLAIENPNTEQVVVISSRCPDPDRAQEFVDRSSVKPASPSAALKPFVHLHDRAPESTADRWYRVLVDNKVGSEQVTQFVGSIPPGRAPDHFHNYEEVLFILKGEGRMWAGQTHTPISVGSCIYLPKGQIHCVENTGAGELRLLGVFYPAGSPSVRYDV
jgi:mannose-6-phosphate isomerase-like protein (cupin superfamily)